jgi:hypothetical protein
LQKSRKKSGKENYFQKNNLKKREKPGVGQKYEINYA